MPSLKFVIALSIASLSLTPAALAQTTVTLQQGLNAYAGDRVWKNYFDYGGASAVSTTPTYVGPTSGN